MITEDYVSFEVAKLLKEKGFDEKCRARYDYNSTLHYEKYSIEASGAEMYNSILCPTFQITMKWLREVHNLFIFPFPQRNTDSFWVEIYSINKDKNEKDKWENLYCETIDLKNFSTYEEACETAIKYCLENLI